MSNWFGTGILSFEATEMEPNTGMLVSRWVEGDSETWTTVWSRFGIWILFSTGVVAEAIDTSLSVGGESALPGVF